MYNMKGEFMKKVIFIFSIIFLAFATVSCTPDIEEHDVYVTVYPMAFIVDELFENTEHTVEIVPGTTSHEISVEWAPKEIIAMKNAELLFYVGANYDQYIDKKLNVFENANVDIIKIEDQSDYLTYIPGVIHDHDHDEEGTETFDNTSLGLDPHFWISPKRMLQVLELVYDQLVSHFPTSKETFKVNYADLKMRLTELDNVYREGISKMTKPALTSTNLYGYLEADYGFQFIPISSGYHEKPDELLPDDAEHIIDEINHHQITTIIYEKNKTSPASNNIFEEMELLSLEPQKLQFNVLQNLSDDDINENKDYISEMMMNLTVIIQAGR